MKITTNYFVRCNQHGMIVKDHSDGIIWDGMFLIYNQETKTIGNFSDYWPLITITARMKGGFMIFKSKLDSQELTVDIDQKNRKNCKTFYYSSWYAYTPIKLIDCGEEAATWINSCLQNSNGSLRLVQRDCDPLIEEPNFIKNNWTEYCEIYSTRADQKPETFANLSRCVLMTTTTLNKLREEKIDNTYLFRPNIVVSSSHVSSAPFSEEDWEWIKIRDTIIRIIKPVPTYHRKSFSAEGTNLYTNSNEEETAHLGVYCAPIVPGDIHVNDDVYVYFNKCNTSPILEKCSLLSKF
ncbi:hypothetical protein ALC56_03806 [Trachymyrmex septentrionalis]|uniref:Uncharacterized protein n=1 Tax=Trachymyrmex septentrionalis TaxID=34720 RepID=A0A151JZ06_9HYME|nr:hypothetical protein ALC56_03806 [Trachymyrmex septentrionalis]